MSLRAKLFLWIGSLFLLVALFSYFLPRYFIDSDVAALDAVFDKQIVQDRLHNFESRIENFAEQIQSEFHTLNGSLLYVYETPNVGEKLASSGKGFWEQASFLISYNPHLGFLQVSDGNGVAKGISLDNARIYKALSSSLSPHISLVSLSDEGFFLGIEVDRVFYFYPTTLLNGDDLTLLQPIVEGVSIENVEDPQGTAALMTTAKNAASAWEQKLIDAKVSTLMDLTAFLKKNEGTQKEQVQKLAFQKTIPVQKTEATSKLNIAREYLTLVLEATEDSPFSLQAPLGAGFFQKESSGQALLSKDIFFENSLFNAAPFFKENPPSNKAPIASAIGFIENAELSNIFLSGTLQLNDHLYLTLGSNMVPMVSASFSISNELIAFVDEQGHVLKSIDGKGVPITFTLPFFPLLPQESGAVEVHGEPYHFFQLLQTPTLHIFIFIPDTSEPTFLLQHIVSDKIESIYKHLSYQLLIITLVALGVALIVLGLISKRITKPVTMLAKASEEVAMGNYSNVQLPAVPKEEEGKADEVYTLTRSFSNMIQGLKDKEKIRGLLDKVVSKEIAAEILKGKVHLGGESKEVTILFSDIRGFTHTTEHKDPETVIAYLNGYMTRMSQIIEFQGGVIDKYVGDEIMALWGAPLPVEDGPLKAIKTGLLMMQKLKTWNEERLKEGHVPIEIGIGIHTGRVVAGNMGAENRLNYTVLGANVNLASRLCAKAAPMQVRVSKEVLERSHARDLFVVEELPAELYKGFSEPMVTYAVKGFKASV